jgi:hypothetical protein
VQNQVGRAAVTELEFHCDLRDLFQNQHIMLGLLRWPSKLEHLSFYTTDKYQFRLDSIAKDSSPAFQPYLALHAASLRTLRLEAMDIQHSGLDFSAFPVLEALHLHASIITSHIPEAFLAPKLRRLTVDLESFTTDSWRELWATFLWGAIPQKLVEIGRLAAQRGVLRLEEISVTRMTQDVQQCFLQRERDLLRKSVPFRRQPRPGARAFGMVVQRLDGVAHELAQCGIGFKYDDYWAKKDRE